MDHAKHNIPIPTQCPHCGSLEIGVGIYGSYTRLFADPPKRDSSQIKAAVCTRCGLVVAQFVDHPELYKK
jgi:predicted Zn-ribbon and HTH transcriptional regulator